MQKNNHKKDRLDRIEDLLDKTRETLDMAATQTAENTKQIKKFSDEFRIDLSASRKVHDREMKDLRALFKQVIKRIAY